MREAVEAAALFDSFGEADPSFTTFVTSTIPTLVINGSYDVQTGTNWAAAVASRLHNSQLVIVPGVGHGVLFGGDRPMQLFRDFLQNPGQPLDTSCLSNLAIEFAAPWLTGTPSLALGTFLTSQIAQAGSAQWYKIHPAIPQGTVSGISNVLYEMTLSGAPDNFLLRLYDSTDAACRDERCGNGALQVISGESPMAHGTRHFARPWQHTNRHV